MPFIAGNLVSQQLPKAAVDKTFGGVLTIDFFRCKYASTPFSNIDVRADATSYKGSNQPARLHLQASCCSTCNPTFASCSSLASLPPSLVGTASAISSQAMASSPGISTTSCSCPILHASAEVSLTILGQNAASHSMPL